MLAYFTNLDSRNYQIGMYALNKYNKLAYKYIIFDVLQNARHGKLIGTKLDNDSYKVALPCDEMFKGVHGELYLIYHLDGPTLIMDSIEPFNILSELHKRYVPIMDGVPLISPKDKFKIQLLKTQRRHKK